MFVNVWQLVLVFSCRSVTSRPGCVSQLRWTTKGHKPTSAHLSLALWHFFKERDNFQVLKWTCCLHWLVFSLSSCSKCVPWLCSSSVVLSFFKWWWMGMAKWWTHTVSVSFPGTDLIPRKSAWKTSCASSLRFPSHLINFLWSFAQNETSHLSLAARKMWRCDCFAYCNQNEESTELKLNGT